MIGFGCGVRRARTLCSSRGWVLLEVMVAVVVVGILVGPLAGAVMSAAAQAARIREQANDLAEKSIDAETMGAWTWGGLVISARWLPGPALELGSQLPEEDAGTYSAGLWVDGWFQGEWPTGSGGTVVIRPETWPDREGREAVVRVRATGAAWGPPWRSLVPGSDGLVAITPATGSGSPGSSETVVHPPNAGNPELEASWTGGPTPALSLPFVIEAPPTGPVGAIVEESGQSWLMEIGRGLDVYF